MSSAMIRLLIAPLLPFALAAAATAAGGLWLGSRRRAPLLGVAQTIGFLAAYGALLGLPAWPPPLARDKVAYVAAFGALLGILLSLLPRWADALQIVVLAWPIAVVAWLVAPMALNVSTVVLAAALALFGAAMIGPLAGARQKSPRRVLMLQSAVLGLAAIAVLGRAPSLAELALALAASLAGVLVADRSLGVANATLVGPAGTALALAGSLALSSGASRPALLLLALVFAADRGRAATRLTPPPLARGPAVRGRLPDPARPRPGARQAGLRPAASALTTPPRLHP
jgi:hypothetical protein